MASMGRDEPVDELNVTGFTDDTIYKKLEKLIESQPCRAKTKAFTKSKVSPSATRQLEEENEDDSGIPSRFK